MVRKDDVKALSAIHRQLVDALAGLDRANLHAAAAHLVAAIELIENDIGLSASKRPSPDPESAVTVIARRLVREFGSRAETVARAQMTGASGPAMLAWAAIINRIAE